jgi:PhoPQ-activated pathogenicity-related protein
MARSISFIFTLVVFFGGATLSKAEGLLDYVRSQGAPTNISVTEKNHVGPNRISFQSQVWREIPWRHELIIKYPQKARHDDVVVVLLTGGSGGEASQASMQRLADTLGIRAVVLTKVPNQPLFDGKTEDALLSYTLDQYRRSGDGTWPLLFPMVTSVIKGLDTLQTTLKQPHLKVVLMGASKRGWTTYLTGAIDKRIVGIVPAVYEMIAIPRQIALARERYGRDSEKLRPYTALGLTSSLLEPRVAKVISWIDPAQYFSAITMPKLVLLGANDPYWVVDSVREYWNKLPEPKMLRILPNVGHGALSEAVAAEAVASFVRMILDKEALPNATWKFSSVANGKALILGNGMDSISRCTAWRALSNDADFRDAEFQSSPCVVTEDGRGFRSELSVPPTENTAVFVDLEIASRGGQKLLLSTESQVYLRTR